MKILHTLIVVHFLFIQFIPRITFATENPFLFSGFHWHQKTSETKTGPGENTFGIHRKNITIDKRGNIVLRIKKKNHTLSCAEIYTDTVFVEGKFELILKASPFHFHPAMVLGIFLYDEQNAPHYNEIDIEFSTWGDSVNTNVQYAIHTTDSNIVNRFYINSQKKNTKQIISLTDSTISLKSLFYNVKTKSFKTIHKQTFTKPSEFSYTATQFRINLWLYYQPHFKFRYFPKVKIISFNYSPTKN